MTREGEKARKDRKIRGLYMRGDVWYIRIYHEGRDWRFSTGMESKKKATKELNKAKGDKAAYIAEKEAEKDRSKHTLADWAQEYLVLMEQNGRRDMRRRRQCLDTFGKRFASLTVSEITRRSRM